MCFGVTTTLLDIRAKSMRIIEDELHALAFKHGLPVDTAP